MARWSDLATWRGPTPNQVRGSSECRGLVVHIAEGSFEGTVSWCKSSRGDDAVSAHFVTDTTGAIAQLVDTDDTAWTQRAGNGHWLSVENAGHTPGALTPQQVEAVAQLLTRAHRDLGVPLQVATSPNGRGLGHHSMGTPAEGWTGSTWGHEDCPGPAIKAQKAAIVARAQQIANGDDDMTPEQWAELDNMCWRIDAITAMSPVIRGGALKGQPVPVVVEIVKLQAEVGALTAAPASGLVAHNHAGGQTGPAVAA